MSGCSDCSHCETFEPIKAQKPCHSHQPPKCEECFKCYEAEICCHKCNHKSFLKIKLPGYKTVYMYARLAGPVNLTAGVNTPLLFNNIVSLSSKYIYDCSTGFLSVPECGQGIYSISTNMTLSAPVTPSIFTININVNGLPINSFTVNLAAGTTQDVALPVNGYPVQSHQFISVSVSGSTGGVVTNAYFGLSRVADLN